MSAACFCTLSPPPPGTPTTHAFPAARRYRGPNGEARPERVLDVLRCTIVAADSDAFVRALSALIRVLKKAGFVILRCKNRLARWFRAELSGGYRDFLLSVRCPNGHVAEVGRGAGSRVCFLNAVTRTCIRTRIRTRIRVR